MSSGIMVDGLMAGADGVVLFGSADRYAGKRTDRRKPWTDRNVRPTRTTTGKRLGEMAEAAFLARGSRLRFGVACPWGDSDRYDFIVDSCGKLWRVQVKSAHRAGEDGGYSFRVHGHSLEAYGPDEIDLLVA